MDSPCEKMNDLPARVRKLLWEYKMLWDVDWAAIRNALRDWVRDVAT